MRVFVTGASGHIGSAVVPELRQAGHSVTALARSDAAAAAVEALGAEVRRGDLGDLDGLQDAARAADAVVHLAFDHAAVFAGDMAGATTADLNVARAFGAALEGSGKTILGVGAVRDGDPNPRSVVSREIHGLADRGVRAILVAVPPVVHSAADRHGFIPTLVGIARATGVSGYLGDGANRWPAAHTLDVARLFRLALEQAPAGAQLVAAAEDGLAVSEIAEAIGRRLGLPSGSIPPERAAEHFARFPFIGLDVTLSNVETRRLLGWEPVERGLLADIESLPW